jgi:glutathione S-transferase
MTEVEKPLLHVLLQRLELPPDSPEAKYFRERVPRDAEKEQAALAELTKPFAVLDAELRKQRWLGGDRFTVADLNVASVMAWTKPAGIDLDATPRVADWLARCTSRPAFGGPAQARDAAS